MKTLSKKILRWSFILAILIPVTSLAQVRLPKLVGNGMVLQRNADVKIWGWADGTVEVTFKGSAYTATTDKNGKWELTLSDLKAGGPYSMIITADTSSITLNDILVGDVWVSSGQSNMELPVRRVRPLYEYEITHSKNDFIRYFDVPQTYNFNRPLHQLESGHWQKTNPEAVPDFSAVAWFFARSLYDKYDVPIGIINSSLGGSPAEAWVSEGTLKEKFPEYYREAQRFKDSTLIRQIQRQDSQRRNTWYSELNKKDRGYSDPKHPWYDPTLNDADWSTMHVPGYWSKTDLGNTNGVVWFRKTFTVPTDMAGNPAKLNIGRIVDADSVWINGTFVGTTSYQYPPRWYDIPAGALKEGKNTIAVRLINERGNGGFVPDKPYNLSGWGHTIDLKGEWKFRLGAEMDPLPGQTFIRWKPVGLYNGMIAPLLNYRIKGVIWYQGESNTGKPAEYESLFKTMIRDWRAKWNQGAFPFLFVQLANFLEASRQPSESNWARLRESQLATLSLPNTGMAVAIDIGVWNDVHPLHKQEVGERLALAARKIAYGESDLVYSGPIYQSMEKEGDKIVLTFDHTGSGLIAKGGQLHHFAIAGPDQQFMWANAKIVGDNKVEVWSHKVSNPVAVRYAWADNPKGANLYNKEGLPASPFRTDDWEATE